MFYKNRQFMGMGSNGSFVMSVTGITDEGFYSCEHPEHGRSPESWLAVTAPEKKQGRRKGSGVTLTMESYINSSFMEGDSTLLSCQDTWSVIRNTTKRSMSQCGRGWGFALGSFCNVSLSQTWDSGMYWCQSGNCMRR